MPTSSYPWSIQLAPEETNSEGFRLQGNRSMLLDAMACFLGGRWHFRGTAGGYTLLWSGEGNDSGLKLIVHPRILLCHPV